MSRALLYELAASIATDPKRLLGTDSTWLYVIRETGGGPAKIGTGKNPHDRLKQLQLGNHRQLEMLVTVPGTVRLEFLIHRLFADSLIANEWFQWTPALAELVEELRSIADVCRDLKGFSGDTIAADTVWSFVCRLEDGCFGSAA